MLSPQEVENLSKTNLFSNLSGKKILITGASGFIGGYLLESIATILKVQGFKPAEITAITRSGHINCSIDTYRSIKLVSIPEQFDRYETIEQFDIIIHAASPASPKFFTSLSDMSKTNSEFIKNILKHQRNLESFIYFSTGEVYGPRAPRHVSETHPTAVDYLLERSSYPLAKIAGENILINLANEFNFTPKIIRLFHTYGPGIKKNDGRSISDFFWQAGQGTPPLLYSDGLVTRPFLFANDMVKAILYILNSTDRDIIYNVSSEQMYSIKYFAALIAKKSNLPIDYTVPKNGPNHEISPIKEILPNIDKLKNLGWKESFTLEKGIEITLLWVKSQLKQNLNRKNL